jgi:hypothetical protein
MYFSYRPDWKGAARFLPYSLTAGAIYLSGDKADFNECQDWDPMFARWPKWSESYIYTQINEDQVAYWTNLKSIYISALFKPDKDVRLQFDYFRLGAVQEAGASDFPGGDGKTRGDLYIGKLSYVFNKKWSGHILWEGFAPGDYYFDNANGYNWLRTELMFKI